MKTITEIQNEQYDNLIKESTQTLKATLVEAAKKANETNTPIEDCIDEGVLTSIVGGVLGGTVGKNVMLAVCQALGVSPTSTLGGLLTSRAVLTLVGAKLGYKW